MKIKMLPHMNADACNYIFKKPFDIHKVVYIWLRRQIIQSKCILTQVRENPLF
jgi:hypothetical protein